ncbi:GNAT family N-acetyltransferase [uncultured Bacteroides sp.]|uniref:lipid II:glycine glycyltransferase FemX n=1 Tax=uncultured Bacteroides sp. TaxID=162156 RepID=UPI0025F9708D|nr:GNAT family N-acetyltransferase [uncultured Bacteroides sp.]
MLKIVTDISAIDLQEWSKFVYSHPHGNIFQSPEMYDMYNRTKKYSPDIIIVYENNQIIGCLLSVVITEHNGRIGLFSARSVVIGGPLVSNNDIAIAKLMLLEYDKKMKRKAIYSQFRNTYNLLSVNNAFQEYKYKFKSHLNFLISLKQSEEALWEHIGSRRKKQIKKAIKNNLKVEVLTPDSVTEDILLKCYDIITGVYRKAGLPLADKDFIFSAFHNRVLIVFIVKAGHEILGCRLALSYRRCLLGWYAGSYQKYYSLFPNDILIWETLRWGMNNGYEVFDYGGAGSPNKPYGVREFKAQMGGELINPGRYEKTHKPFLMLLGKVGMKTFKMIRR